MIETFSDVVKALQRYIPPAGTVGQGETGFARMKKLAALAGDPQDRYPVIHVGGTSGKGSTATMIAAILAQDLRVGLHTSPHLVSPTERMKINGTDISISRFIELSRIILPHAETLCDGEWGKPTYFEILTAMMFLYFAQERVDVAVVEVGLGGRIDATNIVHPAVAVLTNVGLDHTEILGNTVEEIANDKAGIIKEHIRIVSGVTQPTVQAIVQDRCNTLDASLSLLDRDFHVRTKEMTDTGSVFEYVGKKTYTGIHLSVLGEHQIGNAGLAIRAVEEFVTHPTLSLDLPAQAGKRGHFVSDIRQALASVHIPGRMEIVSRSPTIILDGAHNEDKMRALMESMRRLYPKKRIVMVLAVKREKHVENMVRRIVPICQTFVLTGYDLITEGGYARSYSPEELEEQIKNIDPDASVHRCPDPIDAFQMGKRMAQSDDVLLVTGSLYLIGEIKKISN